MITPEQLATAIDAMRRHGSDDERYEAKTCGRKLSSDVWESVSAFANTRGGVLVLGLSEPHGFVLDSEFDAQRTLGQFMSGIGDGGKDGVKLANPPRYEAEFIDFEGGQLLVVEVFENELAQKPCYIEARGVRSGSFKRVCDKDMLLSATELFELQNAMVRSGADRKPVARLEDLDDDLVADLLQRRRQSRALRGAQDREEKLRRLGVVDADGAVTMAGLLVLGSYPQQYYPKLIVDVAVFPDNEKGAPGAVRFVDRARCDGGVVEMIDTAVGAVARNLRSVSIVSGTGRRDELEIPREVLREAIANAIVHREYDDRFIGQSVSVDVYPNRIEISNPGGLWGTRTRDNLAAGVSECRNDLLMSLIDGVPLSDDDTKVAEGNGTGIPFMIRELRSRALESPKFRVGLDRVVLCLGRHGTEIVENRAWLATMTGEAVEKDAEALMLLLREHASVSVREAHEALGIDSDDVRRLVKGLQERGVPLSCTNDIVEFAAVDAPVQDERLESLRPIVRSVYLMLSKDEPMDAQDLSRKLGKSVRTVQRYLRELIDKGLVVPTAGRSSSVRRYVKA